MGYKEIKGFILSDLAEMLKDAKSSGWPFRDGQFAHKYEPEECQEVQKVIDEVYWEILMKKSSIQ